MVLEVYPRPTPTGAHTRRPYGSGFVLRTGGGTAVWM